MKIVDQKLTEVAVDDVVVVVAVALAFLLEHFKDVLIDIFDHLVIQ